MHLAQAAEGGALQHLRSLVLSGNPIGDAGVGALAKVRAPLILPS